MKKQFRLLVPFPGYSKGQTVETDEDGKFRLKTGVQTIAMIPEKNPQCFEKL